MHVFDSEHFGPITRYHDSFTCFSYTFIVSLVLWTESYLLIMSDNQAFHSLIIKPLDLFYYYLSPRSSQTGDQSCPGGITCGKNYAQNYDQ